MKNEIHKPIVRNKYFKKSYYMTLIYKSIFVLAILLVLLLIKKININSTNNIIEILRKNINYEFNIVDDGKKIYYKTQDIIDKSLKTVSVFNRKNPRYISPIAGELHSKFNKGKSDGIEIQVDNELEPTAIVNGIVEKIEMVDKKGYFVTIRKDNMKFIYGYLAKAIVKEGNEVEVGDVIGLLGTSKDGKKYLRLELQIDGVAVDPLDYIDL